MSKINTDFWIKNTTKSFAKFFNEYNSNKGHWGVNRNGDSETIRVADNGDALLKDIFSNENISLITGNDDVNIYQFLIMVSIMLNETGGKLSTTIGEFGSLEYMFNPLGSINKVSYNSGNSLGNKTAYDLFHDPTFMNVAVRQSMVQPKNINDPLWKGTVYPKNEAKGGYKPKNNYEVGLISECDFYKFRGRGLIQLTGRANYINWMRSIRADKNNIQYNNPDSITIINSWGNGNIDAVATKITNAELDKLFSDKALSYYTLKSHASNKILKKMYNVTDSSKFVDLTYQYGKIISGDSKYGIHFANRVFEILKYIPNFIEE